MAKYVTPKMNTVDEQGTLLWEKGTPYPVKEESANYYILKTEAGYIEFIDKSRMDIVSEDNDIYDVSNMN